MKHARIAGLEVALGGGPDGDGGGDGPLVLLLHGFGAPGNDLVPLARLLDLPRAVRWVFPAAPTQLEMPFIDARAWWMIDLARFEQALGEGTESEFAREEPAGMAEVNAKVVELLGALGGDRVVLGGFSQGAMLALDVALRAQPALAGLCLLSGTLLCEDVWTPLLDRLRGVPVFMSHGDVDPLLPYDAAQRLRELLLAARVEVDWVSFSGGHEIPPPVMARLRSFLSAIVGT